MFGIGKLLGNLVGGVLESIGLGKIAPFVKLGLNALTGNWLGVAEDVFNLVSSFKSNDFVDRAAKRPPIGGFAQTPKPAARQAATVNARLDQLIDEYSQVSDDDSSGIRNMFETVRASYRDEMTATGNVSRAHYSYIRS